jgi:hypothetical protein
MMTKFFLFERLHAGSLEITKRRSDGRRFDSLDSLSQLIDFFLGFLIERLPFGRSLGINAKRGLLSLRGLCPIERLPILGDL